MSGLPIVVVSGLGSSDRGFCRAVASRLRQRGIVVVDHDAGDDADVDVAAVVHLAGAASAGRRLDDALSEDLFQTEALLGLAAEKRAPFVLASRLSVIGARRGLIAEVDPLTTPFGGGPVLGRDIDLARERASLVAHAAHVRAAVDHADACAARRQRVREDLIARGGPSWGAGFERAVEAAATDDLAAAQCAALVERAAGWRFPTASTTALRGFTRALAELAATAWAATHQLPLSIVRIPSLLTPASDEPIVGDALGKIVDRVQDGALRLPFAPGARVEALPADVIADAVTAVVLAAVNGPEAIGTTVAHVATHDRAPLPVERFLDLLDLHLRRQRDGDRPALAPLLHVDAGAPLPAVLDVAADAAARGVASALSVFGARVAGRVGTRAAALVDEIQHSVRSLGRVDARDHARCHAAPFYDDDVRFAQRGLRVLCARAGIPAIDTGAVDWRAHLLQRHFPALDRRRAARRAKQQKKPVPAYDSLAHLLIEAATRHKNRPALSVFLSPDAVASGESDVVDITYQELLERACAAALRLQQAGVTVGDRVVLCAQNHPAWAVCAFGALLLGATLVPLDVNLDEAAADNVLRKARARIAIVDKHVRARLEHPLSRHVPPPLLDLHLTAAAGPGVDPSTIPLPSSSDTASILFTSGTTGEPKGVMLSHGNFCALIGSLLAVFPVGERDRMLSVLPLHHTFEFSCGLLMPLAAGAQVYTPDAVVGERVLYAMKAGRITAIVGVPALWQLLERRIKKNAEERGELASSVFSTLLSINKSMGSRLGFSAGKLLFKPIHDQLGGHLRVLISGGSALPPAVHELFQGLGLPLAEGYGLTETSPVLTVAEGRLGAPAGTVGTPIPGVTLKLVDPETGVDLPLGSGAVGEIWARADNVMQGYFENEAATAAVLTPDRWLKTGDLGTIDGEGRVRLVGRSKDVVVTAAGENIYLDDVEKKLEGIPGVFELTLLGVPDPRGGERLALVGVASAIDDPPAGVQPAPSDDPIRIQAARAAIGQRVLKLPQFQRPAIIEVWGTALPRTSTRKVKRKQVREELLLLLKKRESEVETPTPANVVALSAVRTAIARAAGVEATKLSAQTSLPQDLGFDSLMWVELQGQLERELGVRIEPEVLVTKETVLDVEQYVEACRAAATVGRPGGDGAASSSAARLTRGQRDADANEDDTLGARARRTALAVASATLSAPAILGARTALSLAQENLYSHGFATTVEGASFIPANRNAIVVANHTSHLDMGLVKYALGAWGSELRPLAAKDYFFEGNPLKVAFFEHLTNLVPVDRETGSGLAFEQAKAVVEAGHVVLIFPEGTRREDGTLGAFKPLVAKLSLATGVDVLPMHLDGCFQAFPRGATLPRFGSPLRARIGPVLPAAELRRLTSHLGPVQAARAASDVIRAAVVALRMGHALELLRARSLDDLEGARRPLSAAPASA